VAAYTALLRTAPVGPLFAAAHLHIVLVAAASVMFFGERLSTIQILGCVTITAGVLFLAATEKSSGAPARPLV
jgi:uncharacterized membrane protein